jgi:hypothetical protein
VAGGFLTLSSAEVRILFTSNLGSRIQEPLKPWIDAGLLIVKLAVVNPCQRFTSNAADMYDDSLSVLDSGDNSDATATLTRRGRSRRLTRPQPSFNPQANRRCGVIHNDLHRKPPLPTCEYYVGCRASQRASTRDQIKYQDDQSYEQHDVNEATADMQAKSQ